MRAIYVSAAHKSSGKTTIATALTAALDARRLSVRTFKKGPDYIDPGWLRFASNGPCINLDFNTMSRHEIQAAFAAHTASADVALVEGNKGLHDGVALDGSDSNASLARLLDIPVILVIDATGMTRGIAALVKGLVEFEPDVRVAGVVLNRVRGARHASKLRAAIEEYTDVALLGAVPDATSIALTERHLGLVPHPELADHARLVQALAETAERHVDVSALLAGTAVAPLTRQVEPALARPDVPSQVPSQVRVAVARDSAFNFYYDDDLDSLRRHGAELVFFDTLNDARVPDADAVLLGGGFPETSMQALSRNAGMRASLQRVAASGTPIYAECGGLMYLAERLDWGSNSAPMCGVLPFAVQMRDTPYGRGYVRLEQTGAAPWGPLAGNATIAAHEFHYSAPILTHSGDPGSSPTFAYRVQRGYGFDGQHDGFVHGNAFASYAHLRNTEACPWTSAFVGWVRAVKAGTLNNNTESMRRTHA